MVDLTVFSKKASSSSVILSVSSVTSKMPRMSSCKVVMNWVKAFLVCQKTCENRLVSSLSALWTSSTVSSLSFSINPAQSTKHKTSIVSYWTMITNTLATESVMIVKRSMHIPVDSRSFCLNSLICSFASTDSHTFLSVAKETTIFCTVKRATNQILANIQSIIWRNASTLIDQDASHASTGIN